MSEDEAELGWNPTHEVEDIDSIGSHIGNGGEFDPESRLSGRAVAASRDDFRIAQTIVNSDPVLRTFAAPEWDALNDDAKNWLAIIVREARRHYIYWNPVDTAPYGTPVQVKVGHMVFLARLEREASENSKGDACDQWQAVYDGEHPPCWSEGACWAINADGDASLQPTGWRGERLP